MPQFDVVSRIEMQEVANAVNNTAKEVSTRYDFKGSDTRVELDKKANNIHMVAADKMKMDAVAEIFIRHAIKRKLDQEAFDFEEPTPTARGALKRDVKIREGIDQDTAKKIVKRIKDSKMKVQASIQGDEVRVQGKKIDDLQQVIAMLKEADLGVPLQFINMKS